MSYSLDIRLLVVTACICGAACGHDAAPRAPIADTGAGRISGVRLDGDTVGYRGIPYAAPPVGELRWRPPQPVEPWQGVRDGSESGPACPQFDLIENQTPIEKSEDCLTLNVWTSGRILQEPTSAPVVVWIHGGGFRLGTGASPYYDHSPLVDDGVVLVTFNYRLGRLGFFAHPALAAEHPDEPRGNYWLMDQIAALEWVQHNISAFGGDPNSVTIIGSSAGGVSVNTHMISPRSKGLFVRASSISAGGDFMYRHLTEADLTGPSLEAESIAWAERVGLGGEAATPDAMRDVPVEEVIEHEFTKGAGDRPSVDGDYVPDLPSVIFGQGRHNDVPYIAGATNYEGWNLEMTAPPTLTCELLRCDRPDLLDVYGVDQDPIDRLTFSYDLYRDAFFTAPARTLVKRMATTATSPVYLYEFDYVNEQQRGTVRGAKHSANASALFADMDREPLASSDLLTDQDRDMIRLVYGYWLRFIKTGDPNDDGAPNWPAYDPDTDMTMMFDERGATAIPGYRADVLDFLEAEFETLVAAGSPSLLRR